LDLLADPQTWIALLTLSTLEIVLGVDNLVFISIAVGKLPPERRSNARRIGLALACVTRIMLLVSLAHLARLDDRSSSLFHFFGQVISIRDLVLIGGGIFLVVKGIMEIFEAITDEPQESENKGASATFGLVIAQIALIDIVFSLDSVITAVGMVDQIGVMVAAVIASVAVMLFAAKPIGEFVDRHPSVKVLALAFLVMVGMALTAEAFDVHLPKGYIYVAMAFSLAVEMLNIRARNKRRRIHPV